MGRTLLHESLKLPLYSAAEQSCDPRSGLGGGTVGAMNSTSSSSTPPQESPAHVGRATSSAAPESRSLSWLAGLAGVLAVVSVVSGVVMLVLKWMGLHPWNFLTMVPMVLLPVAFVLLIIALFTAARRRREH